MQKKIRLPYIIDTYPDKAQYISGQEITISIALRNPGDAVQNAAVALTVMSLDEVVWKSEKNIGLQKNENTRVNFTFLPPKADWQGFGADVALFAGGCECCRLSTAFDVVSTWKKAPRYGFLSEFYTEDECDGKDVEQMAKYHLNAVQFYDWMYRHDDLIPSGDCYVDPMGRKLSMIAVRNKIKKCHQYGMKALAYGAVYSACNEFYESHRDWALYKNNGFVQSIGDWLYIMNPSPESPWTEHITGEFRKAVEKLGFDGVHMDTYGFPKSAYSALNGERKLVRLEEYYPALICKTRKKLESVKEDIGIIFNAVSNWPVEAVAPAQQDAVYIEVWDPCEKYVQLYHLICRARELGKKPVILAAYLRPFSNHQQDETIYVQKYNERYSEKKARNCFLLASAVIFASGGYHFVLGENNGILTNNYYVDYGRISDGFTRTVRNYYDFIVRYANLLFDAALTDLSMTHANGINDEYKFENGIFSSYGEPDKIWTIIREKPGYKTISLVNLRGIEDDRWNYGKGKKPETVENIWVMALVDEKVIGVFAATPDRNEGRPEKLDFQYAEGARGNYIRFMISKLEIWDLIYIKVECENEE